MIIVRLVGGLGNQLFQYAAGRRLAFVRQTELKLDISAYERPEQNRAYELHTFNLAAQIAQSDDLARFRPPHSNPAGARLLRRLGVWWRPCYIKERAFTFDASVLHAPKDAYLDGYWQSEKYFKDVEAQIRRDLTSLSAPDGANQRALESIREVRAVSLHVRRGDYVQDPANMQYHGVCSGEYYSLAVKKITETVERPWFFIFSDDPAWAQHNIRVDYPTTYVTGNLKSPADDLRLMSACRYHILANSSFSWWGAWLADCPDKLVVAPRKWFNHAPCDTRDLLPQSWIQM